MICESLHLSDFFLCCNPGIGKWSQHESANNCNSTAVAGISIAFSTSFPHFDPVIQLPYVQVPVCKLPTPAHLGLTSQQPHEAAVWPSEETNPCGVIFLGCKHCSPSLTSPFYGTVEQAVQQYEIYCQEASLQQRNNRLNTNFFNFCAKFILEPTQKQDLLRK